MRPKKKNTAKVVFEKQIRVSNISDLKINLKDLSLNREFFNYLIENSDDLSDKENIKSIVKRIDLMELDILKDMEREMRIYVRISPKNKQLKYFNAEMPVIAARIERLSCENGMKIIRNFEDYYLNDKSR